MSTLSSHSTDLPPEQQAIRAKCFHPTGTFIEFKKEAVEQSIPDRFEEQVRRHPNRLAVKARSQRLTYTELNQSANRVARAVLAQEGNGQETVVLMFEHGAQVLIAILGVLKAGRVYVPLDPTYPRIRISHMLEDSQPSLIITNNQNLSLAHELARAGCRLINIDELDVSLPADDLGRSITPDSLASVFYTSGSTGQPKGVVHNHRNLLHMTRNFTNTFRICASDRLSFLYSSSFIGGAKDTFGALLNGATVCPFDIGMDGLTQLADWLAQEEITIYGSVATVFRRLGSTLRGGDQFPKLRLIIVGGERVNKEIVALYTKYFSSRCIFVTGLGATEINFACGYFIGANSQIEGSTLPVGYPVEGIKALILDDDGQRVDSNQVGEIAIQSRYLSPGYWHRPDLTQLAFRADPNGGEERIYLTGDLGRMLADGCLEHLGRKDFQVKVRGYRVEVAEIEMALLELVSIKEVVVVAREVPTGDQRLVAYLVPATELAPSFDELRSHLREKLPDYMVPPAFVFLDALPTLPNGKVNRRGLPSAGNARQALDNDYLAPRTESEETLVRIWAEFLGLDQVGVHDNFLGLGGDSLLAGQVSSRIRDSFQVEIPVRRLFETPTVAGLAAVIEEVKNSSVEVQLPAMVSISRQSHRVSMSPTGTVESPTSFAQQRLWFLDQLEPDNSAYNIPVALRLSGLLNVSALEQSLNEIVRRHETLRTTISTDDGQPVQAICPTFTFNIPVLDLRILTRAEREAGAQELVDKEAQRPFDLAQGPLFRTTLLRLNEEEHIFLLTMHHIICDGWSRAVLCRELAALYEAFSTGRPSPLPELPLQYADFAQWQREWLQGEVLESQLAYWKVQLDGIPPLMELPTDRPRPAVQTYRGAKQSLVLSKSLSQSLKALGQRERVTRFMTLLAAFQTLLHRYTGQDDILVGSPIAGRTRIETEELIGFFVNTLVLRGDFSGEPTFRGLLGRVREKALEAYDHQDLPFEKLVDELRSERNLSHSPLFQAMFVLQNTPAQVLELPGLILSSLDVESGTAKFDLTLNLTETELGLSGYLEYNTDLFDAATIDRMLGHFQTLLESIAADPDQPVSTLPLLTEAERHQLLVEWNDTKSEYPQDKCIHELFEEQVERTPDAVAVVFEDQHLTYRELNRRANQLAHHLRSLGVVPEVLVGICAERSLDMVVGLLGVLKAGGAYVPLDPAYPKERLAFMLEDTHAPVLLTQQRLMESLPEYGAKVIYLDTGWDDIAQQTGDNLATWVAPDNLAYVIYTSGSTGPPKGVLVPHQGLCNVAGPQINEFGVGPGSRVLQFSSLNYDASIFEIVMGLCSGATLCLGSREALMPGPGLAQFLREQAITLVVLPPSVLATVPAGEFPALSTLIVAGEACSVELLERWAADRQFFNLYGPTEGTIWATSAKCTDGMGKPPIGQPIANVQVHILDSHLQPVPVGIKGEMYIGGAGLARGYLNQPDLTAKRFIPNPFSNEPTSRLYKTGDLARYLPDGSLEFLGRNDFQVKIRGFRIELEEIEVALRQHPDIREVVITVSEDASGDKRLVAYVVPNQESGVTTSEMRRFLKEKLPDYMAPSASVMLDALPLTLSGKVDRQGLPAPSQERPELETAFVAPRTPMEEMLAGIWGEVLGLERVGIFDNYFDLGGHSLLAMQVTSRVLSTFQVEVPVRSLFEAPTVAEMTVAIVQNLAKKFGEELSDRLLPD